MDRTTTREAVVVRSYLGPGDERSLADDVLDGMTRPFKEIQPKHFYDARGGDLFDRITELDEYYPTRAERTILETRGAEAVVETGTMSRGKYILRSNGPLTTNATMVVVVASRKNVQRTIPISR